MASEQPRQVEGIRPEFGTALSRRVRPRTNPTSRRLGAIGSVVRRAIEAAHTFGLSRLHRWDVGHRASLDVSGAEIRPPIDYWPWHDVDDDTSRGAAVFADDPRLAALHSAVVRRQPVRTTTRRRGLPLASKRGDVTAAGARTAPGAIAERLRPYVDGAAPTRGTSARDTSASASRSSRASGSSTRSPSPRRDEGISDSTAPASRQQRQARRAARSSARDVTSMAREAETPAVLPDDLVALKRSLQRTGLIPDTPAAQPPREDMARRSTSSTQQSRPSPRREATPGAPSIGRRFDPGAATQSEGTSSGRTADPRRAAHGLASGGTGDTGPEPREAASAGVARRDTASGAMAPGGFRSGETAPGESGSREATSEGSGRRRSPGTVSTRPETSADVASPTVPRSPISPSPPGGRTPDAGSTTAITEVPPRDPEAGHVPSTLVGRTTASTMGAGSFEPAIGVQRQLAARPSIAAWLDRGQMWRDRLVRRAEPPLLSNAPERMQPGGVITSRDRSLPSDVRRPAMPTVIRRVADSPLPRSVPNSDGAGAGTVQTGAVGVARPSQPAAPGLASAGGDALAGTQAAAIAAVIDTGTAAIARVAARRARCRW